MKPKLLYLMHVPWGWIKQRPHFLAEKLNHEFDVTVYATEPLRGRTNLKINKTDLSSVHRLVIAGHLNPIVRNNKWMRALYNKFFRLQVRNVRKYKYVWVSNLAFYPLIERCISPEQVLIYDCMDDDIEFPEVKGNPALNSYYNEIETKLLKRANKILFSAKYLQHKVLERNFFDLNKSIVINNATELQSSEAGSGNSEISRLNNKIEQLRQNHPNALYIGTIAKWLNFELIKESLEQNDNLKYYFVGPLNTQIPEHPNIIHLESVERSEIFMLMNEADALIMPFQVTELIKSVNPVKLYEYISANKPVIAPLYGETEVFVPYIYTYSDDREFIKLSSKIGSLQPKNSKENNLSFVERNTWTSRADEIISFIRS